MHFTGGNDTFLGNRFDVRTWHFIVFTFDGTRVRIYFDGQPTGMMAMAGGIQRLVASTNEFFLGDPNEALTGSIDELWISRKSVAPPWVLAVHRSITQRIVTVKAP